MSLVIFHIIHEQIKYSIFLFTLYQELLISKNMWSNFYKFNSIWIRYD